MNFDSDLSNTEEYLVTAGQIFECCGVESTGSLCVDALMDKFTPLMKTNKTEFSFLKTLLDPDHKNPDINVTKLANALHKCSENMKIRVDLDESFNLKSGHGPLDSDSGISNDGLQLLDDLQCELKEKEHLAHKLRAQLEYSDRAHEEALAALAAERDSLRAHLNMVREECAALPHLRRDYDEACERLCASETELADANRELDALRKRLRADEEKVALLETEKLSLHEQLSKSKDECHRINEMYAARQSALLEASETARAERGELAARLRDQEDFLQQIIKEKVHLEMELKDVLNKSNQTNLRFDRSIDVSYTDDQMLTTLDTLHAESRFASALDSRLLDEDSFLSAIKDDHGRPTNMSLFDEIRLSSTFFTNKSRLSFAEPNTDKFDLECSISKELVSIATQTDDANENKVSEDYDINDTSINSIVENKLETEQAIHKIVIDVVTQTDHNDSIAIETHNVEIQTENNMVTKGIQTLGMLVKNRRQQRNQIPKPFKKTIETQTKNFDYSQSKLDAKAVETQTEMQDILNLNNNVQDSKCPECEIMRRHKNKLESDLQYSNLIMAEIKEEISKYETNLEFLQKLIDEGKDKNKVLLTVVQNLMAKIEILQAVSEKHEDIIGTVLDPEMHCVACQTEFDQVSVSTQVDVSCAECKARNADTSSLRRFFWDPLKALFQIFIVICFISAACSVVSRPLARAHCRAAPWRWLQLHDLMDLLFRIEYTADVPM